jgi:dTDP-4-amino-4,6-dideoxygalactose transaminase
MAAGCEPSRHLYQVRVNDRDQVLAALNERGIFPGVHYRDNSEYGIYAPYAADVPAAHAASESIISLPMHLNLSDDDVRYICTSLLTIVR